MIQSIILFEFLVLYTILHPIYLYYPCVNLFMIISIHCYLSLTGINV